MKKCIITTFTILTLFLLLLGCSSNKNSPIKQNMDQTTNPTTNNAQQELIDYINITLQPIIKLEDLVVDRYDSVTGDNYTSDEEMYYVLEDEIIPNSQKLIEAAEKTKITDKKLKEAHEIYIAFVVKQHSAFSTIVIALEDQDSSKIVAANEILAEARKLARDYQSAIEELKTEYNVVIE